MKKQNQKKLRIDQAVSSAVNAYRETGENTDPMGMYTGNVTMGGAPSMQATEAVAGGKTYQAVHDVMPVQDADDL